MAAQDTSGTIKSDETLFTIIDALYEDDEATLAEIAEACDVSKSTVHRHLATLANNGYVTKQNNRYSLGYRFLDLGGHVRNRDPFHKRIKSTIQTIADETGEFVSYVVEEDGIGTYLYAEMGSKGVKNDVRIGRQVYLHQSAAGKAILANMPTKRVRTIIDDHGLPARTEYTVTDRETLMDDLEQIRRRGYAYALKEHTEGLLAIGVPVHYPDGSLAGGILIAGPTHRMDDPRLEKELPQMLKGTVREFELNISYS